MLSQAAVMLWRAQVENCWSKPAAGNCCRLAVSTFKSNWTSTVCLLLFCKYVCKYIFAVSENICWCILLVLLFLQSSVSCCHKLYVVVIYWTFKRVLYYTNIIWGRVIKHCSCYVHLSVHLSVYLTHACTLTQEQKAADKNRIFKFGTSVWHNKCNQSYHFRV